jgi:hypothetical protein
MSQTVPWRTGSLSILMVQNLGFDHWRQPGAKSLSSTRSMTDSSLGRTTRCGRSCAALCPRAGGDPPSTTRKL